MSKIGHESWWRTEKNAVFVLYAKKVIVNIRCIKNTKWLNKANGLTMQTFPWKLFLINFFILAGYGYIVTVEKLMFL